MYGVIRWAGFRLGVDASKALAALGAPRLAARFGRSAPSVLASPGHRRAPLALSVRQGPPVDHLAAWWTERARPAPVARLAALLTSLRCLRRRASRTPASPFQSTRLPGGPPAVPGGLKGRAALGGAPAFAAPCAASSRERRSPGDASTEEAERPKRAASRGAPSAARAFEVLRFIAERFGTNHPYHTHV